MRAEEKAVVDAPEPAQHEGYCEKHLEESVDDTAVVDLGAGRVHEGRQD